MRQIIQIGLLVLIAVVAAFAQPSIGGIVNSASYAQTPNDSTGKPLGPNVIAQGCIFVIFGTGIGPASLVQASSLPLVTSLPDANGTSVAISSGGQTVNAFMVYTLATQVAAILPSNTAVGQATVTVTFNGKTSAPYTINVVKSQFGLFTTNQGGTGQAIAQVFASATSVSLMGLTTPAQPGQVLVLYGTGLGGISVADNQPPGAVPVGSNVVATVGGKIIPVQYAGRSPQFPGLDQINFQLPSDVPLGCYVPASVTASGQVSQDFVLSIAANGAAACTHPLGLSTSAMAKLDSGGTLNIGLFQVLRAFVALLRGSAEGAGGLFDNANANAVFQMYNRIPVAFGAVSYPAPLNGCVAVDQVNTGTGFTVPDFSLIGGKELIADQLLMSIDGPGNPGHGDIFRQDTGGYLGVFISPILGPGAWTVSGSGGVDVGPFKATVTLPANLDFTNQGNLANPPRSDLNIFWTGGTLAGGNPIVTVFGNSTVVNVKDPSKSRGKSFYCAAPATAGKMVVPAAIMQQLPSSTAGDGETAFGSLGITTGGFATFTATLTKGTLDAGSINYGEAIVLGVKYQ
jgi:uncharacterized protein (TIGR03437 family)